MNWINIVTTLITSTASIIVALIAAGFFKNWMEKFKERKSQGKLVKQIQKDEVVHYTIREIRRKYNADRIYIMQFHNGGMFYTQAPMQKVSITFERCSDGLERMFERFQNLLSLSWVFSEIPDEILDGNNFSEKFKEELLSESNSLQTYLL